MKKKVSFAIYLIASIFFEVCALYILIANYPLYDYVDAVTLTAFHVISASIGAYSLRFLSHLKQRAWIFCFIFLVTIPIFGYYSIYLILNSRENKPPPQLYSEFLKYISVETKKLLSSIKLKNSFSYLRSSFEIEPLVDTAGESDDFKKLVAIKNLGKLNSRNAVGILKKLLNDENMDVRYYAGEELAKKTEYYNLFIQQLNMELRQNPDNADTCLTLGTALLDHALSGLLDKKVVKEELLKSSELLEKAFDLNPAKFETNYYLGLAYYHLKNYEDAIACFKKALGIKNNDMSSIIHLAGCCWAKKDFKSMDEYVLKMKQNIDLYKGEDLEEIREFIEFWEVKNAS